MDQSVFYVDKTTDTFADVLLTYGVAALLDCLLRDNVGEQTVRVKDAGSVYAIDLETPIREQYTDIAWFCDVPFLQAGRKGQARKGRNCSSGDSGEPQEEFERDSNAM